MRRSNLHNAIRLFITVLLIISVTQLAPPRGQAATDEPTLFGFATDGATLWSDIDAFTHQTGRPPAFYQLFWGVQTDWSAGWVANILSELNARGITPYIEVTTSNLDALNGGSQDAKLREMATTLATWLKESPGRHMLIAPLPEANISDHPWSGDPVGYKAGYRRIRSALLDEGLTPRQIRFLFAPNGVSDSGPYEAYYPGDDIVDMIGFAKLNYGSPWRDYEVTFQRHIDQLRTQISLSKPILITQTGSIRTGTDGESRTEWLNDMFAGLRAHDQVIGAIYFNRDKTYDYRFLVNGRMDQAVTNGHATWSTPSQASWIFDGRMDAWIQEREQRFGDGFLDVHGHNFEVAINWLAAEGITLGCNPPLNTRFCPDEHVTRGQMAVFLSRALNLPAPSDDHFADDDGQFYENAVNRLFEAGITDGCGPSRYCGDEEITREQMAAFLARTHGLPATTRDSFVDDEGSIFESAINKVAQAGITLGCNPPTNNRYCPTDLVTRGQMAAFIRRSFGP
jgi:hypothetical protein